MDVKYMIHTDRSLVKDVVKVILSTILFQRILGSITPQTRQALTVSYPSLVNQTIDTLIEEKASQVIAGLDKIAKNNDNSGGRAAGTSGGDDDDDGVQISVQFFEKRSKKPSWFGTITHQQICWEQWTTTIKLCQSHSETEREMVRKRTISKLKEILKDIATTANSNKNHIPPITTTDVIPFPYRVVVIPGDNNNNSSLDPESGWGSTLRKMLVDANNNI